MPALEISVVLGLCIFYGLLALSEAALSNVRRSRLESRLTTPAPSNAGASPKSAETKAAEETTSEAVQIALDLSDDPDSFRSSLRFFSLLTVLSAGALSIETILPEWARLFLRLTALPELSSGVASLLVLLLLSFLFLVFGEYLPRRIGTTFPESIAVVVARPIYLVARFFYPFSIPVRRFTDALLKLFSISAPEEPQVTEDEIRDLIEQGAEDGLFEEAEENLILRAFNLGDRQAASVMTPRTEISWVDINANVDESLIKMTESGHTLFPVCEGSIDKILGIISLQELWGLKLKGKIPSLHELLEQPLIVPSSMLLINLLERLRVQNKRVSMVIDEYGGVDGIITYTDIVTALLGELPSKSDQGDSLIIQRPDGTWLVDPTTSLTDLKELLDLVSLPGEEDGSFHTLGGFIMSYLGRVPTEAESFVWNKLSFEVVDMDGTRIDKVLVSRLLDAAEEEESLTSVQALNEEVG